MGLLACTTCQMEMNDVTGTILHELGIGSPKAITLGMIKLTSSTAVVQYRAVEQYQAETVAPNRNRAGPHSGPRRTDEAFAKSFGETRHERGRIGSWLVVLSVFFFHKCWDWLAIALFSRNYWLLAG